MKIRSTGFKRRIALGTVAFMIVGIVVIAAAAAAVIEIATITGRGSVITTVVQDSAVARAIDVNGNAVTNATYKIGDELKLLITVPSGTNPIAVHQVFSGRVYLDKAWNVTLTKYSYTLDSGPADTADLGANSVYVVVAFADNAIVQSNTVTMTVTN